MTNAKTSALSSQQTRPQDRSGLTLLEVLAAVMIFAMVMTVLISTSTNAVHRVGTAARRLEADLVADGLLSDLEIQIRQGLAPEIQEEEFSQDQYVIRMTMTDLVPSDASAGSPSASPAANPLAEGFGGDALSMLGGALPEVAGYLRQYEIEVTWLEGVRPVSVFRTTFAYDWQAAQIELASLIEGAAANSSLAENDVDPDDDPDDDPAIGGDDDPPGFNPSFNGRNAGEGQRNSPAIQGL